MNREQKRNYTKKLQSKGFTTKQIDTYLSMKEKMGNSVFLTEGQQVKLNIKKIKSHVDYPKMQEKYRSWVETHTEDIFTVEYDKKHREKPNLVQLKEDTTDPKWLFWTGDLEVAK